MNASEQLAERIKAACASTPITSKGNAKEGKARREALAKIRWTMKVKDLKPDVFIRLGLDGNCGLTTDLGEAQTFDGRDNEQTKLQFWSTLIGEPLVLVLL